MDCILVFSRQFLNFLSELHIHGLLQFHIENRSGEIYNYNEKNQVTFDKTGLNLSRILLATFNLLVF